jgi:hypothetical protein
MTIERGGDEWDNDDDDDGRKAAAVARGIVVAEGWQIVAAVVAAALSVLLRHPPRKEAVVVEVVVDVMHEGYPHHADCVVSLNTNIFSHCLVPRPHLGCWRRRQQQEIFYDGQCWRWWKMTRRAMEDDDNDGYDVTGRWRWRDRGEQWFIWRQVLFYLTINNNWLGGSLSQYSTTIDDDEESDGQWRQRKGMTGRM